MALAPQASAILALLCLATAATASPTAISATLGAERVEVHDFAEVALSVTGADAANPFVDVEVAGAFRAAGGVWLNVDGFCDAMDGSLYRIRFAPSQPGAHEYVVTFRQGAYEWRQTGSFEAIDVGRKGVLRVDPEHPWHFIWEGNGGHFLLNGTTTYYLMGWDDATIRGIVDRLAGLGVNRLRVLLYGRNDDGPWGQPVVTGGGFHLHLEPWPAERPGDIHDPGFDLTRFNVEFWRKYERMLRYAWERDVTVSVIFFIGAQVLPTPFAEGSPEEHLYYRYGVARLAAFSNVTWDLGNEHDFHRSYPEWANDLGPLVLEWDPYDHLTSAHNKAYRGVDWPGMQLIQRWDEGQYDFVLGQRRDQEQSGRIVPQVIEEYGYEDLWENSPGQRSAETRRRCAWEISMAGGYQTTGESARQGTGVPPDSGGGWVNGRGDDGMVLLPSHRPMMEFLRALEWWRCDPMPDLASFPAIALGDPGRAYAIYVPHGAPTSASIRPGRYEVRAMNCRSGEWHELPAANGDVYATGAMPDEEDWAILLTRSPDADTAGPVPVDAMCAGDGRKVTITFSEAVDPVSSAAPSHYRLDGVVAEAVEHLAEPGNQVVLAVRPLEPGRTYTLEIEGVTDLAEPANSVGPATSIAVFRSVPEELLALRFSEGDGRITANEAPTSAAHPKAVFQGGPQWSGNVPTPAAGPYSVDFGAIQHPWAVDLEGGPFEPAAGLRSFTITGWINSRDNTVGPGGNRIVSAINNGADGFDLVLLGDGSLQLGVNQWPDGVPSRSNPNRVAADPGASADNWVFFAVTYDSTAANENVSFYFGDVDTPAEADASISYHRGAVGAGLGPCLTVGHFNPATRGDGHRDRMFRGLIDEIRLYGSRYDGAGALDLESIRRLQRGEDLL
jgi:hypothetical protein